MRAVSRSERVIDVYVAEIRKFLAEFLAVFLLARLKTGVFEQHAFAVAERRYLLVCVLTDKVGRKRDFAGENFGKSVRNGFQRKLLGVVFERLFDIFLRSGGALAFGQRFNRLLFLLGEPEPGGENVVRLAQVRAKYHLRAVVHQVPYGGKCAVDAVFVGNHAVNHRHVEIDSRQTLFAFDVDISDCHLAHRNSPYMKIICGYSVGRSAHPRPHPTVCIISHTRAMRKRKLKRNARKILSSG